MSCVGDERQSVYRPRTPQASPLFQLLEAHFPEFEQVYAKRYAERYGAWRPAIARAVADYLKCGDLREGFARVHCARCGHDLFVALSCRKRCLCPSCHQKQSLQAGLHVSEEVCVPVPHRQFINSRAVWVMRSWKHSGFSVDRSVRIHGSDRQAVDRITQYMVRCPFSLERIVRVTPEGNVVYRTENAECRPFAFEARECNGKPTTVVRNFELFEPLDFIAEVTQHLPNPGEHLVRYYGWYSNKSRGLRAKQARQAQDQGAGSAQSPSGRSADTPGLRRRRMRWAELIRRVYEVDPLLCPKCGGTMKVIAFIERRDQAATVEKILRHCGLWTDPPPCRAPPSILYTPPVQLDLLYVAEDAEPYDDARYDASG